MHVIASKNCRNGEGIHQARRVRMSLGSVLGLLAVAGFLGSLSIVSSAGSVDDITMSRYADSVTPSKGVLPIEALRRASGRKLQDEVNLFDAGQLDEEAKKGNTEEALKAIKGIKAMAGTAMVAFLKGLLLGVQPITSTSTTSTTTSTTITTTTATTTTTAVPFCGTSVSDITSFPNYDINIYEGCPFARASTYPGFTAITGLGDDEVVDETIPFDYPFFGSVIPGPSAIKISTNGLITVLPTTNEATFVVRIHDTRTAPFNVISGVNNDQDNPGDAEIHVADANLYGETCKIIEWTGFVQYDSIEVVRDHQLQVCSDGIFRIFFDGGNNLDYSSVGVKNSDGSGEAVYYGAPHPAGFVYPPESAFVIVPK